MKCNNQSKMFVSQERGAPRKPFQKPNILRRKSKVVRLNAPKNETPHTMSLSPDASSGIQLAASPALVGQSRGECSQSFQIVQASKFSVDIEICDKNQLDTLETLEINGDSVTIYAHNSQEDNNEPCPTQSILNVESFLTDGSIKQNNVLFNIDGTSTSRILETETKSKWCLDFMSDESKDTVTTNYYDGSQLNNIYVDKSSDMSTDVTAVPLAVVSLFKQETNTSQGDTNVPAQNLALDSAKPVTSIAVKFKCDVPNCSKEFWTEARLQKHKHVHYKEKPTTPTVLECPVKKTDDDGNQTKCGRTFLIRNQLMKHLNDDHSPEEALFRCTACGRRFFWAGGARAHQAGACARAFACGWAGCGRVFRQPCRLREHARAHTGDRPYPCDYPNCGWAFRSASKLVRHARRHTGERRHACGACGRAFLRREHLRDHTARHHAPRDRAARARAPARASARAPAHAPVVAHRCPHAVCNDLIFSSSFYLDMHLKKVHENNEDKTSAKRARKNSKVKKEMFVEIPDDTQTPNFEFVEESIVETTPHFTAGRVGMSGDVDADVTVAMDADVSADADGVVDVELEGKCARTHCTWPLQRRREHYALEEDAQVEQSESSESNIYTVRSDLFLHGNVLINEDSEFIIRAATGGDGAGAAGADGEEGGARAQLDALGLIDSHPTIDLMQEELMYADAVDESSFRVFLLNGEELT